MSREDSLRDLFAKRARRTPPPPPFEAVHAAFTAADRRDAVRWRHALVAFAVAASAVLAARSGWLRPDGERFAAGIPTASERARAEPVRPSSATAVCREGIVEPLVCRADAIEPPSNLGAASADEPGGFSRAPATLLSCVAE